MKKILLSLFSISLITAPMVSTSCTGIKLKGRSGHKAIMMTNATPIKGNAFSQGTLNGITKWGESVGDDLSENYIIPPDMNTPSLNSQYSLANSINTNALVLSGQTFETTIPLASSILKKGTIIWVDGSKTNCKNVISIQFKSELSGFKAGYNAVEYAYKHKDDLKLENIVFGLFGGMSISFGVNNYIWGFLVGINTWMHKQSNYEELKKTIKIANEKSSDGWSFKGDSDIDWFSGNFNADPNIVNPMLERLNQGGANIIFPVAGPQISYALSDSRVKYVVGVDTDQVEEYDSKYNSKFLTSAMKDVKTAVFDELSRAKNTTDKNGNQNSEFDDGKLISDPSWSSIGTSSKNKIQKKDWDTELESSWEKVSINISEKYQELVSNSDTPFSKYINGTSIEGVSEEIAKLIKNN